MDLVCGRDGSAPRPVSVLTRTDISCARCLIEMAPSTRSLTITGLFADIAVSSAVQVRLPRVTRIILSWERRWSPKSKGTSMKVDNAPDGAPIGASLHDRTHGLLQSPLTVLRLPAVPVPRRRLCPRWESNVPRATSRRPAKKSSAWSHSAQSGPGSRDGAGLSPPLQPRAILAVAPGSPSHPPRRLSA
jgi:hypothetical protein